ncbi:MAG TPA: hypothetical protein VJ984_05475 [Xanthomonadales bacterium]|nr:hypothetical protein [Xanthomonadales bacterium]
MRILKASLWIAAVFNFLAAYVLAFPSSEFGAFLGLPRDTPVLYLALCSGFIFLFGCAYAWMALKGVSRPLLLFGAFGKASVFLLAIVLWMSGHASVAIVGLAIVDALFASVWFVWLIRNRTNHSS